MILTPFVMNLCGKSTCLFINVGDKDLVFGSSIGVCNLAYADKTDFPAPSLLPPDPEYGVIEIIKSKRVNLFIESSEKTFKFSFESFSDPDYKGFDFPWLLFLLLPICLMVITKNKEDLQEERNDNE